MSRSVFSASARPICITWPKTRYEDHVDTPQTWLEKGMAAGSPFAAAHTFTQTGPFRRKNLARGFDNVVLAGSGTVPGVGVPTVLLSGRLAAERITGTRERASAVGTRASN